MITESSDLQRFAVVVLPFLATHSKNSMMSRRVILFSRLRLFPEKKRKIHLFI
jgi:hypothetical protein